MVSNSSPSLIGLIFQFQTLQGLGVRGLLVTSTLLIPLKTQLLCCHWSHILSSRSPSALLGFLEQAKFSFTTSDVHTPWSIHYDKMQSALSVLPLPKIWGYVFVALTSKNKGFTISPSFSIYFITNANQIEYLKFPQFWISIWSEDSSHVVAQIHLSIDFICQHSLLNLSITWSHLNSIEDLILI